MSYGYNARNSHIDVNECTSRGACSISPSISSLSELAMVFLQHIAYYVIRLEKLGASNDKLKFDIINILASFVSVNEFSEEQLFEIVQNAFFMLEDTKKTYNDYCKRENITSKDLKEKILFSEKTSISKAISIGEKIFLRNFNTRSSEIKNLITILDIVMKSVSLNIIKLTDFNEYDTHAYDEVISTLDLFNHRPISSKKVADSINKLAELDNNLQLKISDLLLSSFGGISKVEVSHSSRKGKAILVSGNNFFDLLKVLRETKGQDVDIYTHSNLLITHALKVFHEFEHLKGHYGDSTENCILDFATFPGAILLTKNSKNNTEYLYRGRLFSNDYIVPKGVIKVENNDYSELIEAAKEAKGFSKGKSKPDTILGYNENELNKKFEENKEKLVESFIEYYGKEFEDRIMSIYSDTNIVYYVGQNITGLVNTYNIFEYELTNQEKKILEIERGLSESSVLTEEEKNQIRYLGSNKTNTFTDEELEQITNTVINASKTNTPKKLLWEYRGKTNRFIFLPV